MALLKSLLVFFAMLVQRHAASPPNIRPPTENLREQRGLEHALPRFGSFASIIVTLWATFEIALTLGLSEYCPPALASSIRAALPASLSANATPLTTLTPTFLAGIVLMITGGLLRVYCFRTLGAHFTFELAIQPAHVLVTGGPYSVVRHPSYTGALAGTLGWLLCLLDLPWVLGACAASGEQACVPVPLPGLDGGQCSAVATSVLACTWVALLGWTVVAAFDRMDKEDVMLRTTFGDEWRAWARRVPCRLVPGIY